MKLTNYEKKVILASLDHMEGYWNDAIEDDGSITEDTYNLRIEAVNTARIKIQQVAD